MKKRTTTHPEQLRNPSTPQTPLVLRHCAEASEGTHSSSIHQPLKRYASLALTLAVAAGGLLMLTGHTGLGKGLILGAFFSVVNFILMAVALPIRIGRGRAPSTLIALASIAVRYAVLATPLIIAVHHSQFAITSAAAGLFMIQLAILLDQAWATRRNLARAEE